MHGDLRLRQRTREQGIEDLLQRGRLFVRERESQVFADIPFRKQHQFTQQQGAVIFRQDVGLALHLDQDQRIDRIKVQLIGRVIVQLVQIHRRAEVAEQQEAARKVLRIDVRHADAGAAENFRRLHETLDIFLWRRRIHDDIAFALVRIQGINPEITAETGVR